MVVQGANDPRVNKREADQIVVALRDRNYPVEYILAPTKATVLSGPLTTCRCLLRREILCQVSRRPVSRDDDAGGCKTSRRTDNRSKSVVVTKPGGQIASDATSAAATVDLTGKWAVNADAGGQQIEHRDRIQANWS